MKKTINKSFLTAEQKNDLYMEGYRFYCEGEFKTLKTCDPWSGMPSVTNKVFAFTDKEEAEKFAETQIWVFNHNVHAEVYDIPEHTKTWEEEEAERRAIKEKREARRKAKEKEKADAMGLTVEEYKKEKARLAKIKATKNRIEELEKELAEMKEHLKKLEG